MTFMEGLKEELQKQGKSIDVVETELNLTATDVVRLNSEIAGMVENDQRMVKNSARMADRYPCRA